MDSDWLVRFELDNSRISCRIFARRSGGSGDTLINVIDAADLKLCLLLRFFFVPQTKIRIVGERKVNHASVRFFFLYSVRSAVIGFTRVARLAGKKQASSAAVASIRVAVTSAKGSLGLTS